MRIVHNYTVQQNSYIGGNICILRKNCVWYSSSGLKCIGMTQDDLARAITQKLKDHQDIKGIPKRITSSSISLWERGRRSVGAIYIKCLCEIFDITEEILCNAPIPTEIEEPEQDRYDPDAPYRVDKKDIWRYDGSPLWVVFPNFERESAWAIYNKEKNLLVFKDFSMLYKPKKIESLYTRVPSFEYRDLIFRKTLDLTALERAKKVYCLMLTTSESVRNRYDGWYYHNEDHSFLVNPYNGLTLPYEGLNVSYQAYSGRPT